MDDSLTGASSIPVRTFRRLPAYHQYLKLLLQDGVERVSAATIAKDLRLGEVQVRKDMAWISKAGGRPRTGFLAAELVDGIETLLGYNRMDEAVLVGLGNLGKALLSYTGFAESGVKIVAAFDRNPLLTGTQMFGKQILPMEKLADLCGRMHIHIGIITVPADQAQEVCDILVGAGILAVWNFAPIHLTVPPGVLLRSENMAASLAMLSQQLAEKNGRDAP